MPKSKRNKLISLTRKKKNPLELKKNLVQEVQSCVDKYSNIFLFSVSNMRNSKLKEVREEWKDSRFFFGKNKVMAIALGRCLEEDYKPNLHKISKRLSGQCGLLFSNRPKADILNWFNSFADSDFARSGNTATYSVDLPEGPLPQFPHSMEPYLRQLGLPTTLKKGIICLIKEHKVCNEGDVLTPEVARILKLLGHEMAEFKITLECMWSNDGTFTELMSPSEVGQEMNVDNSDEEDDEMLVEEGSLEPQPKLSDGKLSIISSNKVNGQTEEENKESSEEKDEVQGIGKVGRETNDKSESDRCETADENGKTYQQNSHEEEESSEESPNESGDNSEFDDIENTEGKKLKRKIECEVEPSEEELIEKLKRSTPTSKIKDFDKNMSSAVSSPEDKSPLVRTLRNRTVKIQRKKKK